ncbi:hypothetical protein [Oscillatoria sp. HE19RPO]|uniref:hypothetical protein n=1 Tax=Oscillatoria sp. HE19RPO TaxID=2954806 RepID=UPI0020C46700|nr:hypothetical protein [Oscillatoria sp. HE19RPO]
MKTLQWEWLPREKIQATDNIASQIHQVFFNGMGLSRGWSIDGIKATLSELTILGLLYDESHNLSGYAFYLVPEIPIWNDTYLLWQGAFCLLKEVQGHLATRYLEVLHQVVYTLSTEEPNKFAGKTFSWIGCRTQNPVVFLAHKRVAKVVYPFDVTYETDDGMQLIDFLSKNISEIRKASVAFKINKTNGICRRVYSEGVLGDYRFPSKDYYCFEEKLKNWNFHRTEGDSIVVLAQLRAPISYP